MNTRWGFGKRVYLSKGKKKREPSAGLTTFRNYNVDMGPDFEK